MLLEVVPQQIFVLRPDFSLEYANKPTRDNYRDALAVALFSPDLSSANACQIYGTDWRPYAG